MSDSTLASKDLLYWAENFDAHYSKHSDTHCLVSGLVAEIERLQAEHSILQGVHAEALKLIEQPSHEPCATHATEHRVRDTLPCPWCVIDELKRNRDSLQTNVEYFNAQLYRLAKVVQKDGETAEAVVTKTIEILADWPPPPPGALAAAVWEVMDDSAEDAQTGEVTVDAANWQLLTQALWDCGGRWQERLRDFGWEPPALTKPSEQS